MKSLGKKCEPEVSTNKRVKAWKKWINAIYLEKSDEVIACFFFCGCRPGIFFCVSYSFLPPWHFGKKFFVSHKRALKKYSRCRRWNKEIMIKAVEEVTTTTTTTTTVSKKYGWSGTRSQQLWRRIRGKRRFFVRRRRCNVVFVTFALTFSCFASIPGSIYSAFNE